MQAGPGAAASGRLATPEQVARGIVRAIDRRKDVVYLPGFWRLIMFMVRCVPEGVFKKMKM